MDPFIRSLRIRVQQLEELMELGSYSSMIPLMDQVGCTLSHLRQSILKRLNTPVSFPIPYLCNRG
jgi:hypothetical protein